MEMNPFWSKNFLFETLDGLSSPTESLYPKSDGRTGQNYGYLLYRTEASWDAEEERLRIIDGRDRAQSLLMVNGLLLNTRQRLVKISTVRAIEELFKIDILIENMGRVNTVISSWQIRSVRNSNRCLQGSTFLTELETISTATG